MIAVAVRVGRFAATIEATRHALQPSGQEKPAHSLKRRLCRSGSSTLPPGRRLYDICHWSSAFTDCRSLSTVTA